MRFDRRKILIIAAGAAAALCSGCTAAQTKLEVVGTTSTVVLRETVNDLEKDPVPGTVNEVWAEPMYDTIKVPGAIDPSGTYYRKPHTSLVEVRQGKYQKVEYPDANEQYLQPQK